MKHDWYLDENGEVDEWRAESDYHAGPVCKVCFESICVWCDRNWFDDECEGEA